MLALAITSLLIVSCGGDNDEDDAEQAPTASIAMAETPTAEIADTPTAAPEPTATAPPLATATQVVEVSVNIDPPSGSFGTRFDYEFTGLIPAEEYVIVTILPDGTEYPASVIADSGGTYLIWTDAAGPAMTGKPFEGWLSEESEPTGEYVVELRGADGVTVLAKDIFTVLEAVATATTVDATDETPSASAVGPSVRVSPASGTRQTPFIIVTTGLTPNQHYEFVIRYPDGEEYIEETVFDDTTKTLVIVSGQFEGVHIEFWEVAPADPLGEHTLELRHIDTGEVLSSATFTVE